MPGRKQVVEGLFMEEEEEEEEDDASKIRKREFSPSSASSSSVFHNYRFKKAVLVGKRGGGSTTPVPSWRVVSSRSPSISLRMATTTTEPPRRSTSAQIMQPVSARKLAATLWELNEVPVAAPGRRRVVESSVNGSFSPRLSDPPHSPSSEGSDRSGTRAQSRHESSSACSRRNRNAIDVGILDSVGNASFMETETRSRHQSQAHGGYINNLKDISNTLTTSKELLKIISRMWGQQDNRSTTTKSLITALHTELERARSQVNQMVKDQRTDQNSISYLVNRFSEEKAAWKNKQKQTVKAAIESIKEELEVERKLRRRIEKINHGSPGFSSSEEEGEVEDVAIKDDDSVNTDNYRMELTSLRRSTSLVSQSGGRLCEFQKKAHRRSCGDDLQRYKTGKGLRDQILCGSNSRRSSSPSRR